MSDRLDQRALLLLSMTVVATCVSAASARDMALSDPTRPAGWQAPVTAPEQEQLVDTGPLVLQGVFQSAGARSAVIAGRRVIVGDVIGDAEVVSIARDRVLLRVGDETVELVNDRPSVKVQTELAGPVSGAKESNMMREPR